MTCLNLPMDDWILSVNENELVIDLVKDAILVARLFIFIAFVKDLVKENNLDIESVKLIELETSRTRVNILWILSVMLKLFNDALGNVLNL